jgi:hypothetical protein
LPATGDFGPRHAHRYWARTKGKDENGVSYVKGNAIAGRTFLSWHALDAHPAQWQREIADVRIHATTAERSIERFDREEAHALRPINAGRHSSQCASTAGLFSRMLEHIDEKKRGTYGRRSRRS